jgi:diguanylate cyclase (GGDEF)-like protein
MFGYEPKEMVGLRAENFVAPESLHVVMQHILSGSEAPYEHLAVRKDGSIFPVEARARSLPYRGQSVRVTAVRDITERKAAEQLLQDHKERLALATLYNGVGIWDWNLQTMELIWDDSMFALYHIRREDFSGAVDAWEKSLHPDDRERSEQEVQDALAGKRAFDTQFRVIWPNGEVHHIKAVAKVFRDDTGKPLRMLGTNIDITAEKLLSEALARQAHEDYLTGLNNRRYFMERAELELNRTKRFNNALSVLMMDIDFFKRINDRHGHKVGDAALIKLAEVSRQSLREIDLIGRVGGEEFAILLPQTGLELAVEVAERMRLALANTEVALLEGGVALQFTVSIGVSCLSSTDDTLDMLLAQADKALYEAKNSGRNRVCVAAVSVPGKGTW